MWMNAREQPFRHSEYATHVLLLNLHQNILNLSKKALLPNAVLLVLLESLTSNVSRGLYAKMYMEIRVYAGTPIYIYTQQTWDTTHKNV